MTSRLFNRRASAVEHLRAEVVKDARNHKTRNWDTATPTSLNALVAPGAGAEFLDGRDTTRIEYTLYFDEHVDIDLEADAFRIGGNRYAIDGPPREWSPGIPPRKRTVIALKRWEEHG